MSDENPEPNEGLDRNFVLPDWAPKHTQGATTRLAKAMGFSFKVGSKVSSVDVRIKSIGKVERFSSGQADNRKAAEVIASGLAAEMWVRDYGKMPTVNMQKLIYHKEESVTVEFIWQPPTETTKIDLN